MTVWRWLHRGREATDLPRSRRSQLDRQCLLLVEAVRKAEGDLAFRITRALSQAGGLTPERPVTRVTRRRVIGGRYDPTTGNTEGGELREVTIEEREVPADWRATLALGRMRFPEMAAQEEPEPETPGQIVTVEMLKAKWLQLRQQRAAARAAAIDAIGEEHGSNAVTHPGGSSDKTPDQA